MDFDERFAAELTSMRTRLRQRCLSMTGKPEAADDLVQSICLEAWEHRQTLRDPERLPQWLAALASNVCKMWLRKEQRQRQYTWSPTLSTDQQAWENAEAWISEFDLERDLERKEVALLLGRALTRLSPDLQTLLTEHYLEEIPSRESAERRGLSLRTLEKRLERGKVAFRHLLQAEFHTELASFLVNPQVERWESTKFWCPRCGQHHFQARFAPDGLIQFRCPGCTDNDGVAITTNCPPHIKGYQRLLTAMMKGVESHYRDSLAEASRPCPGCGRHLPLLHQEAGFDLFCPHCKTRNQNSLAFFALFLQEGRLFWSQYQRIRLISPCEITFQERPALHVYYQALESDATYSVFFARDTFEILSII